MVTQVKSGGGPEKTTAAKSTEAAKKVSRIIRQYYIQVQEAAQNGEPIAWCMNGGMGAGPYEIRRALGIHSLYPEHYATVCSAKQVGMPLIEVAEGDGYANYTCSYARIGLGYAAQMEQQGAVPPDAAWGGMPQPRFLIGRGFCEPGYKWFQAFASYLKVPVFVFDNKRPAPDIDYDDKDIARRHIAFYKGQILSLVDFLEKQLGKKIDWDVVREFMVRHHKARWLWDQVHQIRKNIPCPMPSGDKFSVMFPAQYMMGTQEAIDFFQGLYDELQDRVKRGVGVIPNEKYRLLFVGIPQWHAMNFFNYLESLGAVSVIDSMYYNLAFDEVDMSDPLTALATRYYQDYTKKLKMGRLISGVGDERVGFNMVLARDYKVDGAIVHLIQSCRPNAIGMIQLSHLLREHLGVPVFFLESDICDARVASEAEVQMKAREFVATVDSYKEKRLREGRA